MDSQDIIAYGKVVPEKFWSERERVKNLCDWENLDFEIDGFVRVPDLDSPLIQDGNGLLSDTRIQLDLTRLVSFYDTMLVPGSLVPERYGKERIKHRLLGIFPKDLQAVARKIEELSAVWTGPLSFV
ncbi:hypothetical protein DFJ43DRAFT_1167164 [Lentinula guzmanii]|uniref:Uncharacterized protein n=3 Tax=Lentinula TaxID=5352 RepID=A0AA38MUH7_9AGAR|nr:hypothetical protein DFJ43DRAFT_1167164 [Lentinula guzmanii]KAJ3738503.1 hypothetical protein DFH05DRAFT_1464586 [Lentinula detonsa]KAJ3738574.1 hypothetical protein DFH05DRAFT_1597840 [Lentinula detonsa]KAJ3780405.1 hypothetical protein GGU10DRAFT_337199 [Lentinula aff. detonsa]KAJ3792464.1 hypothetical protein GGU11DRAFT_859622 [Lentinula aff. detonsa]